MSKSQVFQLPALLTRGSVPGPHWGFTPDLQYRGLILVFGGASNSIALALGTVAQYKERSQFSYSTSCRSLLSSTITWSSSVCSISYCRPHTVSSIPKSTKAPVTQLLLLALPQLLLLLLLI